MKKKMGTFYTECTVVNHLRPESRTTPLRVLVDTGSELTWIDENTIKKIGIAPGKSGVLFETADGRTITRDIGFAFVHVADRFTIDEIVFAVTGDLQILGARTLEGLNLAVDPARKRLVAAGPLLAAALG